MDDDLLKRTAADLRFKAVELLDEARELFHDAARASGDDVDEKLILADRAMLLVRALLRAGEVVQPDDVRLVAEMIDRMAAERRERTFVTSRPNIGATISSFGARLRRCRERAGKTQQETDAIVKRRNMTTQWESGKRKPGMIDLLRLAEAFGVGLDELVYGRDETG